MKRIDTILFALTEGELKILGLEDDPRLEDGKIEIFFKFFDGISAVLPYRVRDGNRSYKPSCPLEKQGRFSLFCKFQIRNFCIFRIVNSI